MGETGELQGPGSNYALPAQADAHTPKSITIAFEHISGRQLQEALLHMMGGRLSEVTPVELGAQKLHFDACRRIRCPG